MQFDELLIYLDITDIYDETTYFFDKNNQVKKYGYREFFNNFIEGKFFIKLKNSFIRFSKNTQYQNKKNENSLIKMGIRSMWTYDKFSYKNYGEKDLQLATKQLDSLLQLLQKHNIKMQLFVYPLPPTLLDDNSSTNNIQVKYWEKWASENNIPFHSHFPVFLTYSPDKMKTISNFYMLDNIHFNEKGNRLIADDFLTTYSNYFIKKFNIQMSYILGISAFYHDSAVCLINNIYAAQEERFTRKKHDNSFPQQSIIACLKMAGITIDKIEAICFYELLC